MCFSVRRTQYARKTTDTVSGVSLRTRLMKLEKVLPTGEGPETLENLSFILLTEKHYKLDMEV